jgi:hypothetical protein
MHASRILVVGKAPEKVDYSLLKVVKVGDEDEFGSGSNNDSICGHNVSVNILSLET